MNRVFFNVFLIFWLLLNVTSMSSQEVLSIEEVIQAIEDDNFNLELARQNIYSAEVLTSKYNRGYLPTLGLNGGVNYGINSQKTVYNFNLPDADVVGATYYSGNVNASASYLIYDGGQRKLRNEQNNVNLDYAALQVDNLSQTLVLSASQIYYSIAQAKFNSDLLEESYQISKDRQKRAKAYYKNGSGNRVDVLNAEVDLNRDSLNLIAVRIDIENLKWQLNQLTLMEDINYSIDTSFALSYRVMNLEELRSTMLNTNSELIALKKNVELIEFDERLAKKLNMPNINANSTYNYNYQKNSSESFLDFNRNNGLDLGLSARWNVLDGGQRKVQEQLSKVNSNRALLELRNREAELNYQLNSLWNSYQNNLLVIKLEGENIEASRINFDRVLELYRNGQQSSIEFRQAQLNLLNAQSMYYNARIGAKLNELDMDFLLLFMLEGWLISLFNKLL